MFSFLLSTTRSLMPIPNRYPGFPYDITDGQVVFELFCDPLCPDCRTFYPTVENVIQHYGDKLQFIYQPLPLPYHTWAFIFVQAMQATYRVKRNSISPLLHSLYSPDQDQFQNGALQNNTVSEIKDKIFNYISSKTGVSVEDIISNFNDDTNQDSRINFKFDSEHAVSGTPTVFLNGVPKGYDPDTPIETIITDIDALLA